MDELTRYKMRVVFAGIVEAILAIIEIYIMINFNRVFLAIAIVALLMVVVLFFLISGVIDINLLTKEVEQKRYEELYNAQKASYLVIRKSFDEMEERLKSIEEGSALPADEIINAQKAVAKVTISRSKENTDALMNSNDELINQLFTMQEKLEENNESLMKQQQELLDQVHQKMDELNSKIGTIETKVSNGVPVQMPAQQIPVTETIEEPVIEEAKSLEEETPVVDELPVMEEESPALDEAAVVEDELPSLDDMPAMEEELPSLEEPLEEAVDEKKDEDDLSSDEIQAMLDSLSSDPEAYANELAAEPEVPESTGEDTVDEMVIEESVAEEVSDDTTVEEPVIAESEIEEPKAPAVDIPDDPNAQLSPEQIAALFSGAADSSSAEEPEAQPEQPEPEEEPAPSEPEPVQVPDVGVDLSDPNRVMSPEEIEKLFANL
ncbi:MAG: hypothetical protein HUJ71_09845 [Pseudobutyrivibrio sp.]|nr:hypothetical protein [Pseudobutyrivibrio sp.]